MLNQIRADLEQAAGSGLVCGGAPRKAAAHEGIGGHSLMVLRVSAVYTCAYIRARRHSDTHILTCTLCDWRPI